MTTKPKFEETVVTVPKDPPTPAARRPDDVPDDELESVAAGHGHERWYHHHEGRRGYYRNGTFIEVVL